MLGLLMVKWTLSSFFKRQFYDHFLPKSSKKPKPKSDQYRGEWDRRVFFGAREGGSLKEDRLMLFCSKGEV